MVNSTIHVLVSCCIGLILWVLLLVSLIINFYCKKQAHVSISKSLRCASISYVVSALLSWIIWIVYASALHGISFYNVANHDVQGHAYIALVLVSGVYLCSFYVFILLRLKVSFVGSSYEMPTAYFGIIATVFIFNLVMYYSMITYELSLYYTNYNRYSKLYPFVQYTYYQFILIDAVMRLLVMSIFNKNLLKIIANQNYFKQEAGNSASQSEKLLNFVTKHGLLTCTLITLNLIHISLEFAVEYTDIIYVYWLLIYMIIEALCIYLGFPFSSKYYFCCCKYQHNLCQFCCRKMVEGTVTELRVRKQSTKHSIQIEEESMSDREEYEMKKAETELQTNEYVYKQGQPIQNVDGEIDHEIDIDKLHTIGSLVVGIESDINDKDSFDIEQIIDNEHI